MQQRLKFGKGKEPLSSKQERYDRDNLIAARAILETPERYEGALLDWARKVVERLEDIGEHR